MRKSSPVGQSIFALRKEVTSAPWIEWLSHIRDCLLVALMSAALGGCGRDGMPIRTVPGGNAKSGALLVRFYGCGSCHVIPGIRGAEGVVGPPLTAFGRRSLIAGAVGNEADNLVAWIVDPQAIEPGTAMPAVGATPAEARDIAAYLYQLQ